MAVHMFRCFVWHPNTSVTEIQNTIDNWLSSHDEWLEDHVSHTVSLNASLVDDSVEYYAVDVRFETTDTVSTLLGDVTNDLEGSVEWYRIGYHSCTHDGDGGDCSFDPSVDTDAVAREWTASSVTIPSEVPDFPADAYDQTI